MPELTFLFSDLVDSTAWAEGLGEERAARAWAEHDRLARDELARWGGLEIDRSDGFFVVFERGAAAAGFALAYRAVVAGLGLSARLAIHTGPGALRRNSAADIARGAKPVEVDALGKPIAARLMSLARGGQILLSAAAREALSGDAAPDWRIASHGHYRLKGVEAPIEVLELSTGDPSPPPPDCDKAHRVVREGDWWRPVREVPHNLVPERDEFVGREAELAAIARRLDAGSRLLTLLGPGGAGKTRLACRYARAWIGDWPGGVVFCDLAEARNVEGIQYAVAGALGVPLGRGDATAQLGHAIAGRGRSLLILDNFEQVRAHAHATVGAWRDRAPEARFVVTSRERLHLPGEDTVEVDALAIDTDAVQLFETRARARLAGLRPDAADAAVVRRIVGLLDGMPLAIELAAARIGVLSPAQIEQRLHDRMALLAGGRGGVGRQATLRAAIDWSWNLLAPWEQAALAQASVFEGGCTMEAAEAVIDLAGWPDAPATLDVVQALVDKSLVRSTRPPARLGIAEPRFGLHASIQEYARERLRQHGPDAWQGAERRHGRHYARHGSDAALEALHTHGGEARRRRLMLELDNIAAACRRATTRADAEVAVASYGAAWEVLQMLGPYAPGAELGAQVLALPNLTPAQRVAASLTAASARGHAGQRESAADLLARAQPDAASAGHEHSRGRLLYALGSLDIDRARYDRARDRLQQAQELLEAHGDRRLQAEVLGDLARLDAVQGHPERALQAMLEAQASHRARGDRAAEAQASNTLGAWAGAAGRLDEALAHFESALAIQHEIGDRAAYAHVLGNLGCVYLDKRRFAEAEPRFEEALAIARELGFRTVEGSALRNLAELQGVQRRWEAALALGEQALQVVREVGDAYNEGRLLEILAGDHLQLGRDGEARRCVDAALAIQRRIGDRQGEARSTMRLAEVLLAAGEVDPALQACRAAQGLAREAGSEIHAALAVCLRGSIHARRSETAQARAALAEADAIAHALGIAPASGLGEALAALREAIG